MNVLLIISYLNFNKGGQSFLAWYRFNKVKALMSVFPDIGLDPKKFSVVQSAYFFSLLF